LVLLLADEQPLSQELEHFGGHIELVFDGLPDGGIGEIQTT
jgi:hypothetical protein